MTARGAAARAAVAREGGRNKEEEGKRRSIGPVGRSLSRHSGRTRERRRGGEKVTARGASEIRKHPCGNGWCRVVLLTGFPATRAGHP